MARLVCLYSERDEVLLGGRVFVGTLIIIAFVVCAVALALTLFLAGKDDQTYSSEKSLNQLSWLYFLLVPVGIMFVVVVAFLV
ncbi:hypothetical protein [Shouchella shacheensis]|uniref:hypothetical protein n=1 Tax=Shouchella shacheensis TaxID=1649580 RepID=UPI0007400D15|nr:hypothetical protein [Shouchella shacheensis]